MLDQIEQEREFERQKAFFEATERSANYRAGLIAAQILNVNRGKDSDHLFMPEDFFPALAKKDDEEDKPAEMDTKATVEYLRQGFGLYVPTQFRQRVGLPD